MLEKNHVETHQKILETVLQASNTSLVAAEEVESADAAAAAAGASGNAGGGAPAPEPEIKSYESVEALGEEVVARCASEVAGVELLKTSSGKILLLSEKKRIVPKHSLIGGYGTGK